MVCPVQDWSIISWRWGTHSETQKLHKSWNYCTSSRAPTSESTSDYSWQCWGGGNWLWDMPTGSEGRTGNAPCRSQICAQDPDSWPQVAALQRLHWNSSGRLRWNFLVQGHHWWWELCLPLRPWNKATIIPVEKPHIIKAKKRPDRWKAMSRAWPSLSSTSRGLCTKICPNRRNCGFLVLLRRFAATAWKSVKTSPQTLAREDLAASPWHRPVSHFRPHPALSGEKQNSCNPQPTVLPWFGTLWLLPTSKNEIEAERTPVWYHWGDASRIAENAWHW